MTTSKGQKDFLEFEFSYALSNYGAAACSLEIFSSSVSTFKTGQGDSDTFC